MPDVYCPYCHTLNSGRREVCKKCRYWLPGTGTHRAVGAMLLAVVIGAAVTGVYAFLMLCGWLRWKRLFGVTDPDVPAADHYADEAAYLIGLGVFVAATVLAAGRLLSPAPRRPPTAAHSPLGRPPAF